MDETNIPDTFHPYDRQNSQIFPAAKKLQDGLSMKKYGSASDLAGEKYKILRESASVKSRMGYNVHSCDPHMLVFIDDNLGDSAYTQFKKHVLEQHKDYVEAGHDTKFMSTVSEEKRRLWV